MSDSHPVHRVLQQYLNRLNAAIVRSPLLDASCSAIGRGRRIDLTHLDLYESNQGTKLLQRMMSGRHLMRIRPVWNTLAIEDDAQSDLRKVYRQIERNLVREAGKIERETGNRSLWMGYPLLHVVDPQDSERSILAPVLLWPMQVTLDSEHQWGLSINRDKSVEDPLQNQIMRAWVERRLGVRLELDTSTIRSPGDLEPILEDWLERLGSSEIVDLDGPLAKVPKKADLPKNNQARIHHAGILGVMRWQNQALMDDLEELLKQDVYNQGPFEGLFLGQDLSTNDDRQPIKEDERHHVTPADYSQEQAVIKSQQEPGVVVHGPPGTGKSQTITNIVGDALARGQKVLVVCQKRAAIDVVSQRLRAVGLDDLYLTIHDATSDREPVIDLLKEQVDRLKYSPGLPHNGVIKKREHLCRQIEEAEEELDLAHEAYHKQHNFGLSFQQLTAKLVRVEDGSRIDPDATISKQLAESNWSSVQQLCEQAELLAKLCELSSPLDNPWRHRLPDFTLTPHSHRRVSECLAAVRKSNDHHVRQCAVAVHQDVTVANDPREFVNQVADITSWFSPDLPDDNPWQHRRAQIIADQQTKQTLTQALASVQQANDAHVACCTVCTGEHEHSIDIGNDPQAFLKQAGQVLSMYESLLEQDDVEAFLSWLSRCTDDKQVWRHSKAAVALVQQLEESEAARVQRVVDLLPQLDEHESRRIQALVAGALEQSWGWHSFLSSNYRHHRRALKDVLASWALRWTRQDVESVHAELLYRQHLRDMTQLLESVGLSDGRSPTQHADLAEDVACLEKWLEQANHISDSGIVQNCSMTSEALKVASKGSASELGAYMKALKATMQRAEAMQSLFEAIERLKPLFHSRYLNKLQNDVFAGRDLAEQLVAIEEGYTDLEQRLEVAQKCVDALVALLKQLDEMASYLQNDYVDELALGAAAGKDLSEHLSQIEDGFSRLEKLEQYDRARGRLSPSHRAIVDHLTKGYSSQATDGSALAEHWVRTIQLSALNTWRNLVLDDTPIVADVDSLRLDELRSQLASAIDDKMKLEPKALGAVWHARQVPCAEKPWGRVLVKRGKNAKRLREIVEIGHSYGLFELRPCWLTNPDTASQVLPNVEGLFDLVIFDEASQLPVEQAAPAVYRARRVVVAGDEHQLPPTSFFTTSADDDLPVNASAADSDEDADATGTASAIDASGADLAIGATDLLDLSKRVLHEHQLTVHYRSRHPALIQHSNWAFYRGNLEAAHPVWGVEDSAVAPIRIHRVDGVYENKQNLSEARYIVDLLDQIWSSDKQPPTIGVVTFNQQQEKLIEVEVDRRAFEDHGFRAKLHKQQDRKDGRQDVGFFVKNLESVQGDERDIIIFSTTFGPTERGDHGTFRRYFGPLTQNGGERRLNVAATRSKHGMIIVTSMPFEKISDVAGGVEPGRMVKARDYLQSYMLYADAVSRADRQGIHTWLDRTATLAATNRGERSDRLVEFDSILEEQVYQRLIDAGYKVDTQVGEAGFRIDLAVRHPEPGRGYLLAIECDGATYHSGRNARCRDVWREQILQSYGWKVFRIWSTRWWRQPDAVMADLLQCLDERKNCVNKHSQSLALMEPAQGISRAELESKHSSLIDVSPPGKAQPKPRRKTNPKSAASPKKKSTTKSNGKVASTPTLFHPSSPQNVMQEKRQEKRQEKKGDLDNQPRKWASQLARVFSSPTMTEAWIAKWDVAGLEYHIEVESRRGKRCIAIMQGQETIEHCVLPRNIDQKVAQQVIDELAALQDTSEITDWFRRFQSALYPDLWDNTDM